MEVTLAQSIHSGCVAVTIQLVGTEAELHSGADAATTEAVLRILKSCGSTSLEQTGFTSPAVIQTYVVE